MARLHEIYDIELLFRASRDRRSALIVSVPDARAVVVAALSSQLDLYDPARDFLLRNDDPEFPSTGLTRTSYVTSRLVVRLPEADLLRRRGALGPRTAEAFAFWWQLKLSGP